MVGTFVRAGIKQGVKKKKILKADRIAEINRKIKAYKGPKRDINEDYAQEVYDIYNKGKK